MLAIKNNLMAENTARQLGRSYADLARSVQRLSSGLRIATARDDAAGMAVSELLRGDIALVKQGSRNALDAISMLQSAEGAMATIDDILVRMKELAEQASTGTYSSTQRGIIDSEYDQLAAEIDRIAANTTFNGYAVLNSTDTMTFHVGFGTISFAQEIMDSGTNGLDIAAETLSTATDAQAAVTALNTAIVEKDQYRAKLGYMMNRLESAQSVLDIQGENLLAAKSRITDVDVATEMAALTRSQVLAQAGISMLAQAGQMPQMALSLLRG